MPSLVTIAEMRTRFNLPDEDTVNSLMDQSLLATTLHVEAWLQTDFDQASNVVEQFLLPKQPSSHDRLFPSFRLNNGFVTTVNSVKASGVRRELSNADPIDQSLYVSTDTGRGVVSVDMLFPENTYTVINARLTPTSDDWFFQFDYDKGFTTANQIGGSPVYQGVPDWLKEVAFLTGKSVYDVGGSCEGEAVLQGPKGAMISTLLAKKMRNLPWTIKPIFPRV